MANNAGTTFLEIPFARLSVFLGKIKLEYFIAI
jgi:hypothetical protein